MKKRIIITSVIGFPTQLINWGGCLCEKKYEVEHLKKELDDLEKARKSLGKAFDDKKAKYEAEKKVREYVNSLVEEDGQLVGKLVTECKVMCYSLSGRMFIDRMTDEINEKYKLITKNSSLDADASYDQAYKLLSDYIQKAIEAENLGKLDKKLNMLYVKIIYSKEFDYTYFSIFVAEYNPNLSKYFKDNKYLEFDR